MKQSFDASIFGATSSGLLELQLHGNAINSPVVKINFNLITSIPDKNSLVHVTQQ